jgi:hypothetical protein
MAGDRERSLASPQLDDHLRREIADASGIAPACHFLAAVHAEGGCSIDFTFGREPIFELMASLEPASFGAKVGGLRNLLVANITFQHRFRDARIA